MSERMMCLKVDGLLLNVVSCNAPQIGCKVERDKLFQDIDQSASTLFIMTHCCPTML